MFTTRGSPRRNYPEYPITPGSTSGVTSSVPPLGAGSPGNAHNAALPPGPLSRVPPASSPKQARMPSRTNPPEHPKPRSPTTPVLRPARPRPRRSSVVSVGNSTARRSGTASAVGRNSPRSDPPRLGVAGGNTKGASSGRPWTYLAVPPARKAWPLPYGAGSSDGWRCSGG